jgi:hypothetical protein
MPATRDQDPLAINQKVDEPPRKEPQFDEFRCPPLGLSPITGLPGIPSWGSLNKYSPSSRYGIGDADSDDEYNWLPMGGLKYQIPANGTTIETLPSPMIWQKDIYLNGAIFLFTLCQNGHLYQTTPAGVTTDVYAAGQTSQVGNATNGSEVVTGLITGSLSVGMTVTGTGVPANTTIQSIDSSSQIHLSNNYTGTTGSVTLSFGTPLFTTAGIVDISDWQATQVLISDSAAQKVYSWDGTTLLIVFNAQPVTYICVSSGRLWMAQKSTLQWTNAGTYNSLSGDSGSYIVTDSSCTNPIICLLDTPSGLFMAGSNWVKFITNLQDNGTPAVLLFQQNTIEGQIGPLTKWSVILVGNVLFWANNAGIWALNGSQPSQISSPWLNGFFANMDFTKSTLSAAYGMINAVPCVFFQGYYNGDPLIPAGYRVFGYTLQGQQFFSYQQGTIKWITGTVSTAIANNNPTVWGCDGTNIFTLFTNTNTIQNAQINTKLWDFGSALDYDHILNVAVELIVTGETTVTVGQVDETNTVQFSPPAQNFNPSLGQLINNMGILGDGINNAAVTGEFEGTSEAAYALAQWDGLGRVRRFGLNLTVNGAAATLIGLVVSFHKTEAGRGS